MGKERLTFWGILVEGIKKFAGTIIGAFLVACFLLFFPDCRPVVKTNVGETALIWAAREGKTETANLLRRYGAK